MKDVLLTMLAYLRDAPDSALSLVTARAVVLQALPRRVLGPSAAPPARALPGQAGSATLTPEAPPPGELLMRKSVGLATFQHLHRDPGTKTPLLLVICVMPQVASY